MNSALKLGITHDELGELVGYYLPEEDRSTHVYVLGSSGVGKSKGLANWILEDIKAGNGCGVIDPLLFFLSPYLFRRGTYRY